MVGRKSIRTRGKIAFSRYFQKLNEGDSVAITIERAVLPNFPKRIQGRTGKVVGKRGRSYIIELKDIKKQKQYIIEPIHLKKIKQIQN